MEITIEQLNANREAIIAEWAKRVERDAGLFNATGPVLARDGRLWMIVREGSVRVYDLWIERDGSITEEWRDGRVVEVN